MSLLEKDGTQDRVLTADDFTSQGETKTLGDDLALVCGCAQRSESWISQKQYSLLWADADLLFGAPRPLTVYENSYILEPNVQRFTVAKVVNSIVPQLYKGLFFDDPPMVLRPRPGTSQKTTDEKTALLSYILDACQFKREVKWGLEQLVFLGTGIWKWGVRRETIQVRKRRPTDVVADQTIGGPIKVSSDAPPNVETTEKAVYKPFFEFRPLQHVLVDPRTEFGDIREAGYVIDVRYMNFYELKDLKDNSFDDKGAALPGWTWDEYASDAKLKELWAPPAETETAPGPLLSDVQNRTKGVIYHSQDQTNVDEADPLAKKLEVLDYVDPKRQIIVINRKKSIFSDKNQYNCINYLSANWWNRPKAFYGMGVGLTVGQNQRVDQGTINAILKILSFGTNPVYLRSRDSNSPTQMIRTTIGKIITVDGDVNAAYKLLDNPKVPAETWAALQNSEANTESTTGADQTLVQGSTAGPRTGMGRSATGASALASASASRLEGPLDNFIDQVFAPFLYILDDLIYTYMSDQEIKDILGDVMGQEYLQSFNMEEFHEAWGKVRFEVLAGSSMSAKKTMAQSMPLLVQFLQTPQFNEFLAEVQGKYIDWEMILQMWMMATEWKDKQDIIKDMTPQMKAALQAKQQAGAQAALQTQTALNDQKAQQKSDLESQRSEDRIKQDLIRFATLKATEPLEVEGEPSGVGFGSLEGE